MIPKAEKIKKVEPEIGKKLRKFQPEIDKKLRNI